MPGKRSHEEVSHAQVGSPVDVKTIKGDHGVAKPVSESGTLEQRRAAATASVSVDALRFAPRQVRPSKPIT